MTINASVVFINTKTRSHTLVHSVRVDSCRSPASASKLHGRMDTSPRSDRTSKCRSPASRPIPEAAAISTMPPGRRSDGSAPVPAARRVGGTEEEAAGAL